MFTFYQPITKFYFIDSIEEISGQLVYSASSQEDDLHSELEAIARENMRSKGVKVNEQQPEDIDLQEDEFTGQTKLNMGSKGQGMGKRESCTIMAIFWLLPFIDTL